MKVQLMLTCLCDAFYGEVGKATVQVLERVGCDVIFPEGQTCCGQPPFNAGDWKEARRLADHLLKVFDPTIPIVTPSSSCAANLREGYPMLGKSAPPTYELGEFLVKVIGLNSWPGSAPPNLRRVAFHPACHGRALHLEIVHTILLQSLKGIELLDFPMAEQCCGFGGAFSTDLPKVSTGIGLDKLNQIESVQPDAVLSTDMGCLMHLRGLSKRRGSDLPMMHFAQYLIRCAEVEAIE